MTGAIMLITDVLFGTVADRRSPAPAAMTMFAALWYVLPLWRRLRSHEAAPPPGPPAVAELILQLVEEGQVGRLRRSSISRSASQTATLTSSGALSSSPTASPSLA